MRKFFSGLMVFGVLLCGAIMIVKAGSEGSNVVGGKHESVTF